MKNDLTDLLAACLPDGIDITDLYNDTAYVADDRENMLRLLASVEAAVDWAAYLTMHADAAASGLEGASHFFRHGIFEKRKLTLKNQEQILVAKQRPLVSIIVPNFNKALFLGKCIRSALNQTLQSLEIIVVDDGSTDSSLKILKDFNDFRLRVIRFSETLSQHMARKIGVAAAIGSYIMFLDSDDYLLPQACKRASESIAQGYDVVAFNTAINSVSSFSIQERQDMDYYLNRGAPGEVCGYNIMTSAYYDYTLSDLLSNKIYNAELCKSAFAQMEDGYFPRGQDLYETFIILSKARRLLKIPDILYVYNAGLGVSREKNTRLSIAQFAETGAWLPALKRYVDHNGFGEFYPRLLEFSLKRSLKMLLDFVPCHMITSFFKKMLNHYGKYEVLSFLATNYAQNWLPVAEILQHFQLEIPKNASPKRIGILYDQIADGGAEKVIILQANMLVDRGYEVFLFLKKPHKNEQDLSDKVNIQYISYMNWPPEDTSHQILELGNALTAHTVDVLFIHSCWDPALLWQILVARVANIPVILFHHSAYYWTLLNSKSRYIPKTFNKLLSCADKVICLSQDAELFFKLSNVNAQFIANPFRTGVPPVYEPENRNPWIIVLGRMGAEVKQILQCLLVLSQLKSMDSNIKIVFTGSFVSDYRRKEFLSMVDEYGLENNIILTGWCSQPELFIDQCRLLFCASYSEGFPLSIAEAQSRGLPCVMYDIPITQAECNESIVTVPQGDYENAAREIYSLINNFKRLRKLSSIALAISQRFTPENFIENVISMMNQFQISSQYVRYYPEEYKAIIKTLAFYGGQLSPWEKPDSN